MSILEKLKDLGTVRQQDNIIKVFTRPSKIREVVKRVRELGYDTILTISVIDVPGKGIFVIRYVFSRRSMDNRGMRIVVYVKVSRDRAEVPTISDIYMFADYLERECSEMYGVRFVGNERCRGTFFLDRSLEGVFPHRKA
ncbi:MAG: hypothetical protein GXO10_03315 [Crenarchaeota archaeon]|nr:hypothetical protein [Thermoproteota archaeon]